MEPRSTSQNGLRPQVSVLSWLRCPERLAGVRGRLLLPASVSQRLLCRGQMCSSASPRLERIGAASCAPRGCLPGGAAAPMPGPFQR
eukprot:6148626-Alexandrium_andersonii.AAC.1